MANKEKNSRLENSWILYDWANSAFSISITTAILPLFFKMVTDNMGIASAQSTSIWAYTNSIATLIVSILAPILGTIADYKDMKKRFFMFFALLGVSFTGMLAFAPGDYWIWILAFYVLSLVGFSGANIFYDAFLLDVTTDEKMDKVSTQGFAYGYIGSTIPFIISIIIIMFYEQLGIPEWTAYKMGFVITALWWGLFTIPFIRNVKQVHYVEPDGNIIMGSFKRLYKTFKNISSYRHIFWFLVAYFFYIDGVNTIIKMAAVYGNDVGIGSTDLLLILLATQFMAFPFAILYGRLAHRFTAKRMIEVAVIIYIFICFYAYQLDSVAEYWVLAVLVASSQGGIQALSRSYFGKLVPKEQGNEFFGFYNIFGKFAAISGPLLVGITTSMTGSSRFGVFSIAVLFIVGLVVLIKLPNQEKA